MATAAEPTKGHTEQHSASLESIIGPWPIAACISQHLPVGDLISLARTNIALRASLHGFGNPQQLAHQGTVAGDLDPKTVRAFLNIGLHDTRYWSRLKDLALPECSSEKHTKGKNPRPCRFCSRPICEACIVRDSFLHSKGNTFHNRCRFMCPTCWDSGNSSKSKRFPLANSPQNDSYAQDAATDEVCTCTLKNDGHLCIPCKNLQNSEAASESVKQCHGLGCNNPVGEDYRRRRICTWCHKPLPGHVGGAARLEWNQKIIDARQLTLRSRQADIEEYNVKRLKLLRMSRRELRGDEAVKDNPDADTPQYVRHLDTFNYRRFMSESTAPSGNEVYQSKKGYWVYRQGFLKQIGKFCSQLPLNQEVTNKTSAGASTFARTTLERQAERRAYSEIRRELKAMLRRTIDDSRLDEWHSLKAVVLDMLILQEMPFKYSQMLLLREYDFMTDMAELSCMLSMWGYTWANSRSQPEPELDQPERDKQPWDSDLQSAIKLQEQMDHQFAEDLQYDLFDEEVSEDDKHVSLSRPSSTDVDHFGAEPEIDNFNNTKSKAQQGESSNTTGPLRADDPPPYGLPSSKLEIPVNADSKQANVQSYLTGNQEVGACEEEHGFGDWTTPEDKGKGKANEFGLAEDRSSEAELPMAFDFQDSQDDSDRGDAEEDVRMTYVDDDDDDEVGRQRNGGGKAVELRMTS